MILERRPNEQLPIDGDAADDDVQETLEVGKMEVKTEFDEVVVWGHERLGNAEDDIFVRGVEEWLAVADKVSLLVRTVYERSLLMTVFRFIRIRKQSTRDRSETFVLLTCGSVAMPMLELPSPNLSPNYTVITEVPSHESQTTVDPPPCPGTN